jgi:hypothetical protein
MDHVLFGPKNWKVRLLTRFYAVSYCESGSDEIKRAASGIDDRASIADHEQIDRALLVSYQNFISGVRIRLHDKFVWAVPLPTRSCRGISCRRRPAPAYPPSLVQGVLDEIEKALQDRLDQLRAQEGEANETVAGSACRAGRSRSSRLRLRALRR